MTNSTAALLPDDKDQLPGRLRELQTTEHRHAGPVNCIRPLGEVIYDVS
jgi:hypothetical protein